MAVSFISLVILINFFMSIFCFENLCRRSTTTASLSSMHEWFSAEFAVDGRTGTDYTICSHTGSGFPEAWFQVDLKDYFSLKSVKIYYRNDSKLNWPPYRFRQFYLDVSNSSASVPSTSQRIRCHKDETEEPDVPPAVIDIPCKHTARYIIVGTSYDAPEDNPIEGAILEICEIEVYGCSVGKFGELCEDCKCVPCSIIDGSCSCSANYQNRSCDSFSGHCTNGCKELYYGPKCDHLCSSQCNPQSCNRSSGACTGCINGYYGPFCNQTCSSFCQFNTCDFHTGECYNGCKSNWTGEFCNKCDDSGIGRNCSEKCSINCKGQLCNNVTGTCTNGCETGFFKEACNEHCNPGCYKGCNIVTGYCDNGCVAGKFGTNCHENCGSGCLSKSCARINGNCSCANGWKGDKCTDLDSSDALYPTSVGLGAGVGSSVVILVFGIVFAIVIYNRRKRLAYKKQKIHSKENDNNKTVVFRREDNQKDLPPNILSEKNTSKNTVDVYVNEINRGFESKTYDGISKVDKCGAMQKNEYLSISEAIQDMSIYDQLHL